MKHTNALKRYGLFDAKVPRFTSFPPANWFTDAVTGDVARDWRAQIKPSDPVSLYVHIPFCKRLCWFCACRTQGTRTDAPLDSYVARVIQDITQTRSDIPGDVFSKRLHLGGGTPTILPPVLIDRLLSALDAQFDMSNLQEFSVEIDPTDVGPARLAALRRFGMNRASLGIQDFDDQVQEAIGRHQSFDQTRRVVDQLRDVGVMGLNFDLLYGLPFQTQDSLRATLDDALSMNPDRIALFGYAHVPWMSKRQIMIPSDALPSPTQRYDLFETARLQLLEEGFVQIGIDHFAKPHDGLARAFAEKRLRRSFQGYTDDRAGHLLGFGASAISTYPQGFTQNIPVTGQYAKAILSDAPAVWRGYSFSSADTQMARFVEDLLCYHTASIPAEATQLRHMVDAVVSDYDTALDWNGVTLCMRRWAHPLVRIIAARIALNVPASGDPHRYSPAI